jgi:hypothetical protein
MMPDTTSARPVQAIQFSRYIIKQANNIIQKGHQLEKYFAKANRKPENGHFKRRRLLHA